MSFKPKEDRKAERTPIGACAIVYTHRIIKYHSRAYIRTYGIRTCAMYAQSVEGSALVLNFMLMLILRQT